MESPVSSAVHRLAPPRSFLWLIVLAQAAIHLAALPFTGFNGDTLLLQRWATTLFNHPPNQFYAREKHADHLPGDLWILKLEGWLYHAVSGHTPANPGFLNALKLGPGLADIGLALTFFLIVRDLHGARAGRRVALLFALNPAPIFISMLWGDADSVSMVFVAVALLLTLQRRIWAAFPVLAYACLIKPEFSLLAPVLLIFFLRETGTGAGLNRWARPVVELLLAGVASVGVLLATVLPFDVGPPLMPRRWALVDRVQFAANLYPRITVSALNFWEWFNASGGFPKDGNPSDRNSGLFGLTYQRWGLVLAVAVSIIMALPLIRKGGKERLLFTSMAVLFTFFMLQTRIHERYFFPAVALMAAVAASRPRWIWLYGAMTSVYFAGMVVLWWWFLPAHRIPHPRKGGPVRLPGAMTPTEIHLLVGVNLALLAAFMLSALRDLRTPTVPRGTTTGARIGMESSIFHGNANPGRRPRQSSASPPRARSPWAAAWPSWGHKSKRSRSSRKRG